ncbi:hypothetical protein ACO0QE_000367 [Hanseniaspora vineae]
MDPQQLLECFVGTLNQNAQVRSQAEQHLKEASKVPGFLGACLDIISSEQAPNSVKLSASLYFKNKILYGWSSTFKTKNELLNIKIDQDEKPVIKELFIKALTSCSALSPGCLRILQPALNTIVVFDYRNGKWDQLLPESLRLLSTNDINAAHIGLLCISEICKSYKYSKNDSRQEFEKIILEIFPHLLQYGKSLMESDPTMENAKIGEMVKLIVKCYKFSIYTDLPFTLQREETFIEWANFQVSLINHPLNAKLFQQDTEYRKTDPWCKTKKWSYFNLTRLFSRYASDSMFSKTSYPEFASMYTEKFMPHLLELFFQQLEQWGAKTLWLADEPLYLIIKFIEECVHSKSAWAILNPHFQTLLQHVVAPILKPTEETLEIFESDPQEYINRYLEAWNEDYSPDFAAVDFLKTCIKRRPKYTLKPTLEYISSNLSQNFGESSNITNAIEIESSLRIFSNIVEKLVSKNSNYVDQVEQFLTSFVLPMFDSPYGFLKARACEIFFQLGDFTFKNVNITRAIYTNILRCFTESNDENIPVVLYSAVCMQVYIADPEFQETVKPIVLPIMEKLLKVSNDLETDILSGVLQEFVEQFSEELKPFGVELMNNLVQQFLKLAIDLNEASNFDINAIGSEGLPDEHSKQTTAVSIVSTIISILLCFENSKEIVKSLEQSFYPAAEYVLNNEMEDFYHDVCDFFDNSCFLTCSVSPIAWKILELIGELNRKEDSTVGFYLESFMLLIKNYFIYGKQELTKNQFYADIIFNVYCKSYGGEDADLDEINVAFNLSGHIILAMGANCPAAYLERLLTDTSNAIIAEREFLNKRVAFGITSFNVLLSSMCSFPELTLSFLQSKDLLPLFMHHWLDVYVLKFKRVFDIKLSLMAMLSLLSSSEKTFSLLPPSYCAIIGAKFSYLMNAYPHALKQFEEKRKQFSSFDLHGSTFDDDFGFADGDDDWNEDLDIDDEAQEIAALNDNAAYMDLLQKSTTGLQKSSLEHESEDEDADDFYELEEDPLAPSVLEDINLYELYKSVLPGVSSEVNSAVFGSLPQEDQQYLQSLLTI